jgi:hypothetical protein
LNSPELPGGYGGNQSERTVITRYKKLFRTSPEAAILAIYGMVHVIVLLVTAEVEPVKALLHVLGLR